MLSDHISGVLVAVMVFVIALTLFLSACIIIAIHIPILNVVNQLALHERAAGPHTDK